LQRQAAQTATQLLSYFPLFVYPLICSCWPVPFWLFISPLYHPLDMHRDVQEIFRATPPCNMSTWHKHEKWCFMVHCFFRCSLYWHCWQMQTQCMDGPHHVSTAHTMHWQQPTWCVDDCSHNVLTTAHTTHWWWPTPTPCVDSPHDALTAHSVDTPASTAHSPHHASTPRHRQPTHLPLYPPYAAPVNQTVSNSSLLCTRGFY
jgi:hypothetical protein